MKKNNKKEYLAPSIEIDRIPVEEGFCTSSMKSCGTEGMQYSKNEGGSDTWDW